MKKTALVIMAAGIGSRFGEGIKQLTPVDDYGHVIMDYSVYDAIEAGFNEIIFIIRKDIEEDFKKIIGDRIEKICASKGVDVKYCFQDINNIPGEMPVGRTKPWGTGQAVLAAEPLIDSAFAVINADDYYGKDIEVYGRPKAECIERTEYYYDSTFTRPLASTDFPAADEIIYSKKYFIGQWWSYQRNLSGKCADDDIIGNR